VSVSLESQLYLALVGDTTLGALVGGRIYLAQLPQGTVYPALTYQRISTIPTYVHSPVDSQASVGWSRFQITCWVSSKTAANDMDALAKAVLGVLNHFNAWALPASPPVLNQAPSYLIDRRMSVEPNTNPPIFKTMLDVKLWYRDQ